MIPDLYPPPAPLSNPPSWSDIERLALHYPAAQEAVSLVRHGVATREQALIRLAWVMTDCYSMLFRAELRRQAHALPDCDCRNVVCGHKASKHVGEGGACVEPGCACGPGGWT